MLCAGGQPAQLQHSCVLAQRGTVPILDKPERRVQQHGGLSPSGRAELHLVCDLGKHPLLCAAGTHVWRSTTAQVPCCVLPHAQLCMRACPKLVRSMSDLQAVHYDL